MTHKKIWLYVSSILLFWVASQPSAAAQGSMSTDIDAFVQERLTQLGIPGASLAIVRGEEVVHLKGYGVANRAGDPVTSQTPFLLASLSKSITAVAVMQLIEADKITLDAPVQEYLPWFIPQTPITVRQLLNQTSGLDEAQGYARNLDPDGPQALEQSIRQLATAELNHAPGTAYEYSNSNYDVLGLLIETVSGQPYGEYVQANIFSPLEMTHAFASLSEARQAGMSSAFYPFFGRPIPFDDLLPYSGATQPAAGLIGSVEDLSQYLMVHLNQGRFQDIQLLTPASMSMLHTPSAKINDAGLAYAMGWAVWSFEDAAVEDATPPIALSHGGHWLGANHLMLLIPEEDFGLVLLLNSNDPTISSAYSNIAFDVALLALGHEPQNYPPQEDWITRQLRPLSIMIILLLLIANVVAWHRLRTTSWARRDVWLFIMLAVVDLGLIIYTLLIRLPQNQTSLRQVVRFEPDLGLMLLIIILLTLCWGSVRSLWALGRWRKSSASL